MTRLFNKSSEKARRRSLRKDMPTAEVVLWSALRGKQVVGWKFRRQYSIGSYIVDFYCPSARLAIEVDGDSHYQPGVEQYDKRRQAIIESTGIHVLRFTNAAVRANLDEVIEAIKLALAEPPVVPLDKGDRAHATSELLVKQA